MLQLLNRIIGIFADTFRLFGQGRAWLYLFAIFILDVILLYAHEHFQYPLFYGLITGWAKLMNHDYAIGFTHYPGHYMLLPYFFYRAKLLLGFLIEGAVLGAVALYFYRYLYQLTEEEEPLKDKLYRWLNVSIAWIVLNGLIFLSGKYLPQLFRPLLAYSPRRQLLFDYAVMPAVNVVILALLFVAIAYIAIYRVHVINGIWNSLKFFFRAPVFMLVLSGVILIIPTFFTYLLLNQNVILEKFNPELIYWILNLSIFLELFVNFFWISAAVQLLIDEE